MEDNAISKVLDLLTSQLYANLGTQNEDGTPWISNVFFSIDKDLNLLWYSRNITQHSQNILRNPIVALNITKTDDIEDVDAVYITAEVKQITKRSELMKAMLVHGKKMLRSDVISKKAFSIFVNNPLDLLDDSKFRLYKAEPRKVWKYEYMENWREKYVDGRVEFPIKDLREQFQQS